MPPATLQAPTPRFRTTVGNSSAVYTGIITLLQATSDRAIIASTNVKSSWVVLKSVLIRHTTPLMAVVRPIGQRLPSFSRMIILMPIDGISTNPVGNWLFFKSAGF